MLPSPSCGSPPKCRGASWKFSTSTLTTTARPRWTAPLRGETKATVGSPGGGSRPPARPASSPPPNDQHERPRRGGRDERGEDWRSSAASEPEHYASSRTRCAMSRPAELAYRIGAAARQPGQLAAAGQVRPGRRLRLPDQPRRLRAPLRQPRRPPHGRRGRRLLRRRHQQLPLEPPLDLRRRRGACHFQAARFLAVSVAALAINLIVLEALVATGRSANSPPGDRRRRRDALQLPRQQALDLRLARRCGAAPQACP